MQLDRAFISRILVLALPVALQMLLQSALGMVDVVMVGHLGATALAAVGLAAKLHFLLLVLMSGLATSCSVLMAQYLGAKNFAACQRTLAIGLLVGVALMLPFALAAGLAAPIWMSWVNPDPEVIALAAQFMAITAPTLLCTQIIVIYEAGLRAQGSTGVPLLASAISILVNVVLNYGFIFGHWGLPALGVAGAALGTLIARAIHLVCIVTWIYRRHLGFNLSWTEFRRAIDPAEVRKFLRFSAPVLANFTFWGIGNTCYHAITGFAGTDALAARGVMVPMESAFFALFVGMASASAVLVGRALGADDHAEAWRIRQFFERLAVLLLVVFCSALWLARTPILQLFAPSPEIETLLTHAIGIFCALVWLKILHMLRIIGVLRAGGDVQFCLITDLIVMWGLGIPIYAIVVFGWSHNFVLLYSLMFVEDGLKFLPVLWRVKRGRWVNNLTRST